MLAAASEGYNLYVLPGGGAEQDPDEWWEAMVKSTRTVMKKSKIDKKDITGISFCSQMQGLVLVDENGNAVRRAMSYMDQRAGEELKKGIAYGLRQRPGLEIQMGRSKRTRSIRQGT